MPVCRRVSATLVTGPGRTLGQALVDSPRMDGVTFTGSFDVGMKMFQDYARRANRRSARSFWNWGVRNPAIVSRHGRLGTRYRRYSSAPPLACRGRNARPASRVYHRGTRYYVMNGRPCSRTPPGETTASATRPSGQFFRRRLSTSSSYKSSSMNFTEEESARARPGKIPDRWQRSRAAVSSTRATSAEPTFVTGLPG